MRVRPLFHLFILRPVPRAEGGPADRQALLVFEAGVLLLQFFQHLRRVFLGLHGTECLNDHAVPVDQIGGPDQAL